MSPRKQNNQTSNKEFKNNLIFPILAGLILAIAIPFGAKTYKKIRIGDAFEKLDNPNGWTGKYECLNKTPTTGTVTFKFSKWSDGTIRIISNFSRINKNSYYLYSIFNLEWLKGLPNILFQGKIVSIKKYKK